MDNYKKGYINQVNKFLYYFISNEWWRHTETFPYKFICILPTKSIKMHFQHPIIVTELDKIHLMTIAELTKYHSSRSISRPLITEIKIGVRVGGAGQPEHSV